VLGDAERWDARYAGRSAVEPSQPSGLDGISLPAAGLSLDVACGLGEQSLWAAARGFEVVALDASPIAIAALRSAASERGLADRIDARVVDLDDGLPVELTGRCALVICQRFRDPRLYGALVDTTAPGGVLVVTVLSVVGTAAPGEFHAPRGELAAAIGTLDIEVLRDVEGDGVATLVGRRLSPRTRT